MLEPLTDSPHLYVSLLSRYVTFAKALLCNDAFEVRFLAHASVMDMQSLIGKSIAKITKLCNVACDVNLLSAKLVKKNVLYARIPDEERWRLSLANDTLQTLHGIRDDGCRMTENELRDILDVACTS